MISLEDLAHLVYLLRILIQQSHHRNLISAVLSYPLPCTWYPIRTVEPKANALTPQAKVATKHPI